MHRSIILQLWPVYRALKIVNAVHKKDPKAGEEKERFNQQIVSLEPFLESIPSLMVMTFAVFSTDFNDENENAIFGDSRTMFYINFTISSLTASFGMTKYLLTGPCRLIPIHGYLNGVISWRFLLAYITILLSLMAKTFLAIGIMSSYLTKENSLGHL